MPNNTTSKKLGNLVVVPLGAIAIMQMNPGTLAEWFDLKAYYLEAVLSAIGLLVALAFGLFTKDLAIRKQTLIAGAGVVAFGLIMGIVTYWVPDFNFG